MVGTPIEAIKTLPDFRLEFPNSTREFLAKRRHWWGNAERMVVEHYRREAPFPIVPSTDEDLM